MAGILASSPTRSSFQDKLRSNSKDDRAVFTDARTYYSSDARQPERYHRRHRTVSQVRPSHYLQVPLPTHGN
ncbi:hypothetical protein F4778DRAFT_587595 [Xylariomycetidae sp. FL2044]|nr:hypothetical protein F4778DRAFT_587595 [Xylariomycetidae sp. FL2044]